MKNKLYCLGLALLTGLFSKAQDNINDLDAQDYIYHANIVDLKEKTAVVKLFRALKYYGIWDDIHALYLPTGGTELSHSLNAKDPRPDEDAYPLVFPNGATHTHSGVSFNGIDQGAMSLYRATSNRLHLMVYQPEFSVEPFIWTGDRNGITDFYSYTWSSLYTNSYIGFSNSSNSDFQYTGATTGFFYGQRKSHDSTEGYIDGTRIAAWAASVSPYYNTDTSQFVWLNKSNQFADFYGTTKYSVASIGNAMDSNKVKDYYQIIQAFLSELEIQTGEFLGWPLVPDSYEAKITSVYRWHKASENVSDTAVDGTHLYGIGDSLYLWGGWNGEFYPYSFNTGYVSGDGGSTWQSVGEAPWNVRHSAAYGTDALGDGYLIGSDLQPEATATNRREVWRTKNGRNWRLRTSNAPWSGDLVLEGLAIKGSTLYVAGGQFGSNSTDGLNDTIWKSVDGGRAWEAINTTANHLGGILYNNFKYFKGRKKFVAFCGGVYDNDPQKRIFSSQIWVSDDCITWTREKDVPFEHRQYSDMVEWDGKLWVFGGDRPISNESGSLNLRDLWYMDKNGDWHEAGSTPLPPRHASGLAVDEKNNRLLIVCGNMHTDAWYLEKISKGPKFDLPLTKEISVTANCSVIVPDLTKEIQQDSLKNIVELTQQPVAGTVVDATIQKSICVTVTATNALGVARNQVITLISVDTIGPVFSSPDTVTVNLTSDCKLIVPNLTDSLKGYDNCGNVSFYQLPYAGTIIDSHHGATTSIKLIGADEYDNTTEHTVIIKVKDTIPPVFTCPGPQTVYISANCQAIVPDLVSSLYIEDCGAVSLQQIPGAGTLLTSSNNTVYNVTIIATDENNNTSSCIVSLTVEDTTAPVFETITDLQFSADTNQSNASIHIIPPVISDNCETTLTGDRNDEKPLNAPYPVGKTLITWKAMDAAGNESIQKQTITVTDDQLPFVAIPSELNFCYIKNASYTIPSLMATDNCGVEGTSYKIQGATTRSGNNSDATGSFNIGISTIIWTVTDIHGNEQTASTLVKVVTPLEMTIPDVYALSQKSDPNTIYIGYGPSSLTLTAETSGGQAPYTFVWSNNAHTQSVTVEGESKLTVFAEDIYGCKDSASKEIKVVNVKCNEDRVLVCKKEKDETMTACVPSGEVESLLNNGSYLGSCKNIYTTVEPGDSIDIKTIPNPTNYFFKLLIQTEKTEPVSVRIFNSLGQLLDKKDLTSDYIDMNFGRNYLPGIYFAEVISGNQRKIIKLIKTSH